MARTRGMRLVSAATAAITFAISSGIPTASAQSNQPSREAAQVQLYALKHASVGEIAVVLSELSGRDRSISMDQRTNSIIAFGDDAFQNEVKNLISMLDVEVESGQEAVVRAVPLAHAKADAEMAAILSSVIRGRGNDSVRIATDSTTNQLILRGTPRSLEDASMLIEALDRPRPNEAPERDLSFRVVWLVSDSHASGDVPRDMGDVIEALDEIGITDLAVAAQTVVRASHNTPFRANCSAQLEETWDLAIEGRARHASDARMRIDVQVEAASRIEPSVTRGQQPIIPRSEEIQLMTTITTTDGHFVVLGASPVKDMDSVFVIQAKNLE